MSNEVFIKHSVAPLLLRLALAAIFIYHGLEKIVGRENDGGANWATAAWHKAAQPPDPVIAKLDQMIRLDEKHEEDKAAGKVAEAADGQEKMVEGPNAKQLRFVKNQLTAAYQARAVPPATLTIAATQFVVAWGELAAGVALLLGLLTRWAAALVIVLQLGAIVSVTWVRGFSFATGGGYEFNLAIIAMCLAVVCMGPGDLLHLRLRHVKHGPQPPPAKEEEKVVAASV
jgi:uncharacterized membrane protein YphA (DoxX/SURF4 family)